MMKLKTLFTLVMALAAATSAVVAEDTPLSEEMSAMNRAWRKFKKQAANPAEKASTLELLKTLKEKAEASMKFEPAKTKDQPEADKPAYLEKYKEMTTELIKVYDELKVAVEKGDAAQINALMDKVGEMKEKGHEKFAPDE